MQLPRTIRFALTLLVLLLVGSACASTSAPATDNAREDEPSTESSVTSSPTETPTTERVQVAAGLAREFPPAPSTPSGPLDPDDLDTINRMLGAIEIGITQGLVRELEDSTDPRVAWILTDLLRFTQGSELGIAMVEVAETILDIPLDDTRPWGDLTDHLFAWDLPAPPDYPAFKASIYIAVDDRWAFVFDDEDATIDYRLLGWGGVLIDDRELGDQQPCQRGCIPALDDPTLTDAAGGDWYPDDAVIFGIDLNGETVAFPKNIMQVHEMVNITIGDRRLGIPYCTLCGSAQAYFTDEFPDATEPLVLRTSGLLSRSNKVMFELNSRSVFDTFTGAAVTGPLREAGVVLNQATVVVATWGDWKAAHPDTKIVASDGGLGREYADDPLGGRDDSGPIFPIGQVDDRLAVQEPVLTVTTPDGTHIAFPVAVATTMLNQGEAVMFDSVSVELSGGGLTATIDGEPTATHQAFWFAWSQFHPGTEVWLPTDS